MGVLDGIVGGVVGAGLATAAQSLIEKNSGVQGVVDQFEKNGLGGMARSWVGNGPNEPITADQVKTALGQRYPRLGAEGWRDSRRTDIRSYPPSCQG